MNDIVLIIAFTIIVALLVVIIYMINKRKRASDDDLLSDSDDETADFGSKGGYDVNGKDNGNEKVLPSMKSGELLKSILKRLNCTYKEGDDDDIWFTYQGEHFALRFSDDSYWVRIYDAQWFECPLDDLEEISYMQKAVNYCNARNCATACYVIDTEEEKFTVFSKCDFLLNSNFPFPDDYFISWLNQLFRLKRDVAMQYDKEKVEGEVKK